MFQFASNCCAGSKHLADFGKRVFRFDRAARQGYECYRNPLRLFTAECVLVSVMNTEGWQKSIAAGSRERSLRYA